MAKKTSGFKRNVLAISIAFIFVFFIGYGIETFYESPEYSDFCSFEARPILNEIDSEENCLQLNGTWENYVKPARDNQTGWCDLYKTCQDEYNSVREEYSKNVFIITFIIGVIFLFIGSYLVEIESVGSGIMGGSTLTIIYGTLVYWSDLNDLLRFIILGVVLGILIWIGYKKIKE